MRQRWPIFDSRKNCLRGRSVQGFGLLIRKATLYAPSGLAQQPRCQCSADAAEDIDRGIKDEFLKSGIKCVEEVHSLPYRFCDLTIRPTE